MSRAKCIMVQGTMSGAGKSLLCAALCRIFAQDGLRAVPFKSQNMALNSFVTKDGLEMGRAQVVQAQAAGVEPDVRMNPILLKPSSDVGSQVIVNGEVRGQMAAAEYFRTKKKLVPDIMAAYDSLAEEADVIMILTPDETQPKVYEEHIKDHLKPGDTLAFAHGFNIHYGYIKAPEDVNVIMCAPKGPGHIVRRQYTEGSGVPDLACVAQDATGDAWDVALSYCWGVGGARSGIIKATFAQETEEDLFGEQAVLCGGLVELVKAGFETLTEAGYPEELAYFECYHEMKMIVDLMYESGIHFMNYSISNTAEYGEYYAGPKVINEQSREAMKEILHRIQNGEFAQEFVDDCNNDHKWLLEQREAINSHPIEVTGEKIRSMFSWIKK